MVVCAGSYNWPATPQENDCICGVRAGLADASTSLIGSKAGSSLVFCILGFLAFPRTGSQNGVQQETPCCISPSRLSLLKNGPEMGPQKFWSRPFKSAQSQSHAHDRCLVRR